MMPETLCGRRVLVVEDEYFIASEMQEAFEAAGAEVLGPASTVEAALGLVGDGSMLDGAVVDINLRGEMGFPIADALTALGVPFVFATGYDAGVIPPRYAGTMRFEKPVEAIKVAAALFG